jgi:hypothetical protein
MSATKRFVSGYGFSHIETGRLRSGFSRRHQRLKAISWLGYYGTPEGVP